MKILSTKGNVIETFKLGNTTIHICDDFIVSDFEVDTVVKELYAIGWRILTQSATKPYNTF
ncbi:hypothetical protein UB51_15725 [Paenibacillus sp. IHBB 10380]|nr:hypothetical protein UB51_15725 [Paenibacillus sp. IHBB 10380]